MHILGLNTYHPNSSACIIKDGQLIAAVEEERFCRIKYWAGFPRESIRYCLREAGVGLEDVGYIALNRDTRANLYKKIGFVIFNRPSSALIKSRFRNMRRIGGIAEALNKEFAAGRSVAGAKVYPVEHHRAHLASAFFVSPFQRAAAVSIDGFGDFTSCMVAKCRDKSIDPLYEVNYPHSLGLFYTAFTQFLGFRKFGDEYKIMGLAAYGQPRFVDKVRELLILKPRGKFILNLDYFSFYKRKEAMLWDNTEPVLEEAFSGKFIEAFGKPREYEEELSDYHCDIAASVQKCYEEALFHILNYAYEITGESRLCLAGGCALNSAANGKIFDRTAFKDIFIQPASSDAGGALGSAYYLYHQVLKRERSFVMRSAYWGPGFSESEIDSVLDANKKELRDKGCLVEKINDDTQMCSRAAGFIAEGKVTGWFQGRMEWGARALGNRSILVDPRRQEMKDILNARIKKREWFRPFAPAILLEKTAEYFEKDYPDPFMNKVYTVRPEKRGVIPAVTHADGTGRLQTVAQEENPLFWKLIKEFEKLTGVPVLLNTSFNENEPIVCKPQEALDCFLRTRMDILVIGNCLIQKSGVP